MNAKKSLILGLAAFFFIALVFSSGCSEAEAEPTTGQTFVGGSQGLVMAFLQNQPPSQVFQDNPFNVAVQIENKGETDVSKENIKISVEGINPASFDDPSTELNITSDLTGVKYTAGTIIQGGKAFESFSDEFTYTAPIPSGSLAFNLRGKMCYKYATSGISKICLGRNIFTQTTGTQSCQPSGTKTVESSAAPIKISSVEQAPSGTGFTFIIKLANVGGGEVYDRGQLSKCDSGSLSFSDIDKVYVEEVSIGGVAIASCSDKIVRIDTPIICTVGQDLIAEGGAYEDFLQLSLKYGYSQTVPLALTVSSIG